MARYLIVMALLTLMGCKAYKEKVLRKYCIQDTIVKLDTTFIESVRVDTAFADHYMTDTLTITKDRLVLRYIKRDSIVYLSGECLPDTLIKIIKIPYNKAEPILTKWQKAKITIGKYLQFIGLIAIIVCILMLLFKK